jgi:hypothetical protein
MRARIARLAKSNGRSSNAEIVDRLQKSMIGDTIAAIEESVAGPVAPLQHFRFFPAIAVSA